jgi:hypothetical protein
VRERAATRVRGGARTRPRRTQLSGLGRRARFDAPSYGNRPAAGADA